MPDLNHTLEGHDLGFLKIVASAWGIELDAPDVVSALPALRSAMLNRQLVNEVVEALPAEAAHALQALLENNGMMSWSLFIRRFGEIRVMGAARRDRERPDLKPISASEILWYRALIGKDFLNRPPEPQEYVYIPEDLAELIQPRSSEGQPILGRPASPAECAHPLPANDRILDDACTYLAAARLGMDAHALAAQPWSVPLPVLQSLLKAADLFDPTGMPQPEATRRFLESSRAEALAQLVRAWLNSQTFNELRLLPGLRFEGEWQNDPLRARQAVLEMLSHLPQEPWWSLNAFVEAVRERYPDFQRPAGDYDSWFIRKESNGVYLRGFATWDEVDGALIRFLICGPLHWLGIYDLAAPSASSLPAAFRPTPWATSLWHGNAPAGLAEEKEKIRLTSDGLLLLSPLTPRAVRYQVARFCQWEVSGRDYRYRLTPTSLERAQNQGLRISHLLRLLQQHSSSGQVPPSLKQCLERLEKLGVQATLERVTLLRVTAPEILAALRKGKAARYLGETLSPTTAAIKPGGEKAIRDALAELGYLADIRSDQ